MSITINILYKGKDNNALKFAREMEQSGTAQAVRNEPGNLRYEYYVSLQDENTVLLIDSWTSQEALDIHHSSPMMKTIAALRDKYDLHMQVARFKDDEDIVMSDYTADAVKTTPRYYNANTKSRRKSLPS